MLWVYILSKINDDVSFTNLGKTCLMFRLLLYLFLLDVDCIVRMIMKSCLQFETQFNLKVIWD